MKFFFKEDTRVVKKAAKKEVLTQEAYSTL